jgi:hypothetical protein
MEVENKGNSFVVRATIILSNWSFKTAKQILEL